jgi:hypothetical protein
MENFPDQTGNLTYLKGGIVMKKLGLITIAACLMFLLALATTGCAGHGSDTMGDSSMGTTMESMREEQMDEGMENTMETMSDEHMDSSMEKSMDATMKTDTMNKSMNKDMQDQMK